MQQRDNSGSCGTQASSAISNDFCFPSRLYNFNCHTKESDEKPSMADSSTSVELNKLNVHEYNGAPHSDVERNETPPLRSRNGDVDKLARLGKKQILKVFILPHFRELSESES